MLCIFYARIMRNAILSQQFTSLAFTMMIIMGWFKWFFQSLIKCQIIKLHLKLRNTLITFIPAAYSSCTINVCVQCYDHFQLTQFSLLLRSIMYKYMNALKCYFNHQLVFLPYMTAVSLQVLSQINMAAGMHTFLLPYLHSEMQYIFKS